MNKISPGIWSLNPKLDADKECFTYVYPFWSISFDERDMQNGVGKTCDSPSIQSYVARVEDHLRSYPGAVVVLETRASIQDTIRHLLPLRFGKDTYFLISEDTEAKGLYEISLDEGISFIAGFKGDVRQIGGRCLHDNPRYPGCVGTVATYMNAAGLFEEIHRDKTLTYKGMPPSGLEKTALNLI